MMQEVLVLVALVRFALLAATGAAAAAVLLLLLLLIQDIAESHPLKKEVASSNVCGCS